MKRALAASLLFLAAVPGLCRGQAGGNIGYSAAVGRSKAEQNERAKRVLTKDEQPPTETSSFVEASVLLNRKADEFVAVFAVSQEGGSVDECGRKVDATVREFTDGLRPLGVAAKDLFVDFVGQNKVYAYEVKGDIAEEKLAGFELKKTVSIHYRDRDLLDRLVAAAARAQVFDLVKVDYLVDDAAGVQQRLMEEAAKVVKAKTARYEALLGIKLRPPAQVYAERYATYFPSERYDSYTAYGTEDVGGNQLRMRYTTKSVRKSRTFFFNGLDADGFDAVIDPVVVEPVVQSTLYLKIKYQVEPPAAR